MTHTCPVPHPRLLLFCALSALAMFALLAAQNLLFLATNGLVYLYELLSALGLYAALCLCYFALRFSREKKRLPCRRLFPKVFAPALAYSAAVVAGADFGVLVLASSAASGALFLAATACVVRALAESGAPHADAADARTRGAGNSACSARRIDHAIVSTIGANGTVGMGCAGISTSGASDTNSIRRTSDTGIGAVCAGTAAATGMADADGDGKAPPRSSAGSASAADGKTTRFTRREQEVIALVLQGKTTQETADALFVSAATVKTHLQHIYEKAGVRNRASLARFMQQHTTS